MKRLFTTALLASAVLAHAQAPSAPAAPASATAPSSPAKKALIAKVIELQKPMYEGIAREIAVGPASQLGQSAAQVIQNAPTEKREALAKSVDADIHKYIDEAFPLLRDRAVKLAPETVGPVLESEMSEADLKQLVTWLSSPAAKKYESAFGSMRQALGQKLIGEAAPLLNPKLQVLESKVRTTLGIPQQGAAASGAAAAKPPAPAASK